MGNIGRHRELELRLEALAKRIGALRRKMKQVKRAEKIEEFGEIEELQRRYDALVERLAALDQEGSGFRQDVKAELEKIADDLSATVEDFTIWVDSEFQGQHPRKC
jgi:predicted  nucleic acid-binding Zn-ribbon protein